MGYSTSVDEPASLGVERQFAMDMPTDWNDEEGWERYYVSMCQSGDYGHLDRISSIPLRELPGFVAELMNQRRTRAWVPGCGLSLLPKLLARLGMEVHATDISPTAVAYQANEDVKLPELETDCVVPGSLTCAVHDFRKPYLDGCFDLIINVRAIQGFTVETMEKIAKVHYAALKPGRHAYFDTVNVQGEERENLEATLVDAGFFIPLYDLTVAYRRRLRETNIPHNFILGRPMVPMSPEYDADKQKWDRDVSILRTITDQYRRQLEEEDAADRQRLTPQDRIATILYSTG